MIGDASDIVARLKRLLPRWFGQDHGPTPVLDGLLQGPAVALAWVHELYAYARLQTRIATATGGWLDLIALDFFGGDLKRAQGQSDASFRIAIIAHLFKPMATRAALSMRVTLLTGAPPRIFEPQRAADTGAYDVGGCGYDVAGGYGCHGMTAQLFVEVLRPRPAGVPDVSGYNHPYGAFDTASPLEWSADLDPVSVVDAQIYAAIDRVRPVGVTVWTRIVSRFDEFTIVGGGSLFSDGSGYSDGAQHYQPTALA